ncbi:MAG: T9SS type A sorting domain-containing protein [Candidatus Kapabacteria bacterium]|nr:T9SS type A sorting domain-containing protein [Candidatus Kapabacteria bacterium]
MKKSMIVLFLIICMTNILKTIENDNSNWRDFVFDKQAWGLGPANRIVISGESFFVSGYFSERFYDTLSFNGIAELRDSIWLPLGAGITAGVRGEYFAVINDLLIKDSILYVVGIFDSVGTIEAKNIAKWNINSRDWQALPIKVNGPIVSIVECNNSLYIGGNFDTLFTANDTILANNIAYWDGSNWFNLNSGLNKVVNGIYAYENEVFVVGEFDTVDNSFAQGIGIWNDSTESWSTFGQYGPDGEIINVIKTDDGLYFSGYFDSVYTSSGSINAKNIVKWNGTVWSALDDGIDGHIHRLKSNGTNLIVAGSFAMVENDTNYCQNIVKWDGTDWEFFGTGTNEAVIDVAFKGDSMLVGGVFYFTGDTLATNIGLWYIAPPLQMVKQQPSSLNEHLKMIRVYPNPAKEIVIIDYYVEELTKVQIKIFDISGNETLNINEGYRNKGWHRLFWNSNQHAVGVYNIHIVTDNDIITDKFILSR